MLRAHIPEARYTQILTNVFERRLLQPAICRNLTALNIHEQFGPYPGHFGFPSNRIERRLMDNKRGESFAKHASGFEVETRVHLSSKENAAETGIDRLSR